MRTGSQWSSGQGKSQLPPTTDCSLGRLAPAGHIAQRVGSIATGISAVPAPVLAAGLEAPACSDMVIVIVCCCWMVDCAGRWTRSPESPDGHGGVPLTAVLHRRRSADQAAAMPPHSFSFKAVRSIVSVSISRRQGISPPHSSSKEPGLLNCPRSHLFLRPPATNPPLIFLHFNKHPPHGSKLKGSCPSRPTVTPRGLRISLGTHRLPPVGHHPTGSFS